MLKEKTLYITIHLNKNRAGDHVTINLIVRKNFMLSPSDGENSIYHNSSPNNGAWKGTSVAENKVHHRCWTPELRRLGFGESNALI